MIELNKMLKRSETYVKLIKLKVKYTDAPSEKLDLFLDLFYTTIPIWYQDFQLEKGMRYAKDNMPLIPHDYYGKGTFKLLLNFFEKGMRVVEIR